MPTTARKPRLVVPADSPEQLASWHAFAKGLGYDFTTDFVRAMFDGNRLRDRREVSALNESVRELAAVRAQLRKTGNLLNQLTKAVHVHNLHGGAKPIVDPTVLSNLSEQVERTTAQIDDLDTRLDEALHADSESSG